MYCFLNENEALVGVYDVLIFRGLRALESPKMEVLKGGFGEILTNFFNCSWIFPALVGVYGHRNPQNGGSKFFFGHNAFHTLYVYAELVCKLNHLKDFLENNVSC